MYVCCSFVLHVYFTLHLEDLFCNHGRASHIKCALPWVWSCTTVAEANVLLNTVVNAVTLDEDGNWILLPLLVPSGIMVQRIHFAAVEGNVKLEPTT